MPEKVNEPKFPYESTKKEIDQSAIILNQRLAEIERKYKPYSGRYTQIILPGERHGQ
jgi:hypothetical protein